MSSEAGSGGRGGRGSTKLTVQAEVHPVPGPSTSATSGTSGTSAEVFYNQPSTSGSAGAAAKRGKGRAAKTATKNLAVAEDFFQMTKGNARDPPPVIKFQAKRVATPGSSRARKKNKESESVGEPNVSADVASETPVLDQLLAEDLDSRILPPSVDLKTLTCEEAKALFLSEGPIATDSFANLGSANPMSSLILPLRRGSRRLRQFDDSDDYGPPGFVKDNTWKKWLEDLAVREKRIMRRTPLDLPISLEAFPLKAKKEKYPIESLILVNGTYCSKKTNFFVSTRSNNS